MTLIVNLSTLHDYSIYETIGAFAQLSQNYGQSCLNHTPGFFQYGSNYAWVMAQYLSQESGLIRPYKLGEISTEDFFDNLAEVFYFMKDMEDKEQRNLLFKNAWTASIKMSDEKIHRLSSLVEQAKHEPVYIVSNTNEMDVKAIVELFKLCNGELAFNQSLDIDIAQSDTPIELLPNVFLCLSYRYHAFKAETSGTPGLIRQIYNQLDKSEERDVTVVSNYAGDRDLVSDMALITFLDENDFYGQQKENTLRNGC